MTFGSARRHRIGVAALLAGLGGGACGGGSAAPNAPPTASAGADQDVNRGATVTLSGTGTDPEAHALTISWTQLSGAAVGSLSGASPSFTAPTDISTLEFEVTASDGVNETTDVVVVRVLEDKDHALWVAPSGNDANAGTRAQPKGTIQGAIGRASWMGSDMR